MPEGVRTGEEAIEVPTPRGTLRGMRHRVPGSTLGDLVVLCQGYFSSTHVGPARLYVQIGRLLAARGLELVRADPLGVGDSDGDFEDSSYPGQLEDYRAVIARLRSEGPARPLSLLGHSMGASLALRLAAEDQGVGRLLLLSPSCGPCRDPGATLSPEQQAELAREGRTERKGVVLQRDFHAAVHAPDVFQVAARVRAPCLVVRGDADEFYDAASAARLMRALPAARLVEVPGGDHNFLGPGVRRRLLEVLGGALEGWGT